MRNGKPRLVKQAGFLEIGGGGGGSRTHVRNGCPFQDYVRSRFAVVSAPAARKRQERQAPSLIDLDLLPQTEALGLFR